MKISIVGSGYVGLVTGVCFAEKGHHVTCVDVDQNRINQINAGKVPFHEPGLAKLLRRNLRRAFRASLDLPGAVMSSELTLISVGTPFDGKRIDLDSVKQAAKQIGRALRAKSSFHVVAVKSTVVPGTTDEVVMPILEAESRKTSGSGFGVGVNPEFLSEGEAVRDFMNPDRIVLGASDRRTHRLLRRLYRSFGGVPVLQTTNRAAEMIKYASNSLLATLISFSNEIANLCSELGGLDSSAVMEGVHLSQYLSPVLPSGERVRAPITAFLRPGCGFGGSCLPKDVRALIARGREVDARLALLENVIRINESQPERMLKLLRKRFPDLRGLEVSVLGLAFKAGTDDLRESSAISIARQLVEAGARVKAYDPIAVPAAKRSGAFPRVRFSSTLDEAVRGSKALLLVTAWPEFKKLPRLLSRLTKPPVLIDGRRLIDPATVPMYEGIGYSASE